MVFVLEAESQRQRDLEEYILSDYASPNFNVSLCYHFMVQLNADAKPRCKYQDEE